MRAIGVTRYGGPQALHEIDVPAEELGDGQVRVRVLATAVNPTDTGVRSGARAGGAGSAPPPGDVPGMDVALRAAGPARRARSNAAGCGSARRG